MPHQLARPGVLCGLLLALAVSSRGQQEEPAPAAPAGARQAPPAAASGGGALLRSLEEMREAWRIYDALQTRDRLRKNLKAARALLERQKAPVPEGTWDSLHDLMENREYERSRAQRNGYDSALRLTLAGVQKALLTLVPPVTAFDMPDDDGKALIVAWHPQEGAAKYELERRLLTQMANGKEGGWEPVKGADLGPLAYRFEDKGLREGHEYRYRLYKIDAQGQREFVGETPKVTAAVNWFNGRRFWQAVIMGAFGLAVMYYIRLARRGVALRIRKIAGLEAVDDAVGRATEMGRPILFVPGIQDMDNIQTVAGLIVLGRVARVAAEHDATLEVPTSKSLVMTAAREMVSASYLNVGRADAFDDKRIYYVTDEQFGYVAALTGYMVRNKPATCIYMGAFFAESLILAETANTTGSIQIAGTAEPAQLPFFVAACDYTLIGEEFFAASAYLSGEPQQLGSLKGQDAGKLLALVLIVCGILLTTLLVVAKAKYTWLGDVQDFILQEFLLVAK